MKWLFLTLGMMLVPASALAADNEGELPPPPPPPVSSSPPRTAPPAYEEPAEPSVRSAPPEYVYQRAPLPPPIGHRGFQMAIRSGVSLPFGRAKDRFAGEDTSPEHWSSSLDDLTGLQIPVILDIGGKPNKHVFIGAYFGLERGFTAGRLADACERLPLDCYSTNTRLGAQVHYIFSPNDWVTPWVGYGFGYAWMTAGDGQREARYRGLDFAHFLGGLDFRFSRTFGIGIAVDYGLGVYSRQTLSAADATIGVIEGPVEGRTIHQWVTFGPRLIVMP